MSSRRVEYIVRDRSLFLPYYKKLVVDPLVPAIPRWIRPNSITHAGHLLNLVALLLLAAAAPRMDKGWPFVVAPLLVHVWLFCDHADGAHARRTGQCSASGELLDHGLDLLNACYVIWMTLLTFGAPPGWSVLAAVSVAAGAAVIYWEQAEIGVFELGLLTQIESVFSLTAALAARAVLGNRAMERVVIGPLSLGALILAVVGVVAIVGMVRSAVRVGSKGGRLGAFFVAAAFGGALGAATLTGALGTVSAVGLGSIVYALFGVRALEQRMTRTRPRVEPAIVAAAVLCGAAAGMCRLGAWPDSAGSILSVLVGAPLSLLAIRSALAAWRAVASIDQEGETTAAFGSEGPRPSARSHR